MPNCGKEALLCGTRNIIIEMWVLSTHLLALSGIRILKVIFKICEKYYLYIWQKKATNSPSATRKPTRKTEISWVLCLFFRDLIETAMLYFPSAVPKQ